MRKLILILLAVITFPAFGQLTTNGRDAVNALPAEWDVRRQVNRFSHVSEPGYNNHRSTWLSDAFTAICDDHSNQHSQLGSYAQNTAAGLVRVYGIDEGYTEYKTVGSYTLATKENGWYRTRDHETRLTKSNPPLRFDRSGVLLHPECAVQPLRPQVLTKRIDINNTSLSLRTDNSYFFSIIRSALGNNRVTIHAIDDETGARIPMRHNTSTLAYANELHVDGVTDGTSTNMGFVLSLDFDATRVYSTFTFHASINNEGFGANSPASHAGGRSQKVGTRILEVENGRIRYAAYIGDGPIPLSVSNIYDQTDRTVSSSNRNITEGNLVGPVSGGTRTQVSTWNGGNGRVIDLTFSPILEDYQSLRITENGVPVGEPNQEYSLNGMDIDARYTSQTLNRDGHGQVSYTAKMTLPIGWTLAEISNFNIRMQIQGSSFLRIHDSSLFTVGETNGRVTLNMIGQAFNNNPSQLDITPDNIDGHIVYVVRYTRGGQDYSVTLTGPLKGDGVSIANHRIGVNQLTLSGNQFRRRADNGFTYSGNGNIISGDGTVSFSSTLGAPAVVNAIGITERSDGSYTVASFRNTFGTNRVRIYAINDLTGERIGIRHGTDGSYSDEILGNGRTSGNATTLYNHVSVNKSQANGVGVSHSIHIIGLDNDGVENSPVFSRFAGRSTTAGTRVIAVENNRIRFAYVGNRALTNNLAFVLGRRVGTGSAAFNNRELINHEVVAAPTGQTRHVIEEWNGGGIYEIRFNTVADYRGLGLRTPNNAGNNVGNDLNNILNGIGIDLTANRTFSQSAETHISLTRATLTLPHGWTRESLSNLRLEVRLQASNGNVVRDFDLNSNIESTSDDSNGRKRFILSGFVTRSYPSSVLASETFYSLQFTRGGRAYEVVFSQEHTAWNFANPAQNSVHFGVNHDLQFRRGADNGRGGPDATISFPNDSN